MTAKAIADQFAELQFSSQLPQSAREALANIATEQNFAVGDRLCHEGERTDELFLIVEGHVGLDMFVPGRGQVRILTLGPGEILSWSAVVGNHISTATGTAIEQTHTIRFLSDDLFAMCEKNHEVGYSLMKEMAKAVSRRLVSTRLQLLDLFAEQSP